MGVSHKILPHYTYEDYRLWEGNWELIDGFPIAMSPSPLPKHQYISLVIASAFLHDLKKCKKCKPYECIDYKVSEDTILRPDILVACSDITKSFLDFPPALIVEIPSPATALRDRNTKFEIYEEQGIKYYLIVDPENRKTEIYESENKKYKLVNSNNDPFPFFFEEGCSATINFDEIW